MSTKILVQWTEGRYKGSTSVMKKNDVKEGSISVGETVKVVWGKSKKRFYAIVLNEDYGSNINSNRSPVIPLQATPSRKARTDEFTMELGGPPPSEPTSDESSQSRAPQIPDVPSQDSDVLQRLEDFMSRQAANLLQKMDDVSEEMRRMQQGFDELERALRSQIPAEMPSHNRESLPQFTVATPAAINSSLSRTPLQEINLDSSVNLEEFSIPREHIISGLNGCHSQRNLASRLTTRIFTAEERLIPRLHGPS